MSNPVHVRGLTADPSPLELAGFVFDEATRRIVLPFPRDATPYTNYSYPYAGYRCIRQHYIEPGDKGKFRSKFRHYIRTSIRKWNATYTGYMQEYGQATGEAFAKEQLANNQVQFHNPSASTFYDFAWVETVTANRNRYQFKDRCVVVQMRGLDWNDDPMLWRQFAARLADSAGEDEPQEAVRKHLTNYFSSSLIQGEKDIRRSSAEWSGIPWLFSHLT
jgi:hypothetical protein